MISTKENKLLLLVLVLAAGVLFLNSMLFAYDIFDDNGITVQVALADEGLDPSFDASAGMMAEASAEFELSAPVVYLKSGESATIIWNAVENADSYRIDVSGGATTFSTLVSGTEYCLDGVAKTLAATYGVTVTATDTGGIYSPATSLPLTVSSYLMTVNYDTTVSTFVVLAGETYGQYLRTLNADKPNRDLSWNDADSTAVGLDDIISAARLEITAEYTAKQYNITYFTNGGSAIESGHDKYTYGTVTALRAFGSTKQGYDFAGWCESEDLSDPVYRIPATAQGDKIFYAKWTLSEFSLLIYYDDEDGVDEGVGESRTKAYNGNGFTITASVSGGEGSQVVYTYVWYKGGTAVSNVIGGANRRSYTTGANVSDSGRYYVQVIAENKLDSTDTKERTSAVYVFTITQVSPSVTSFGTAGAGVYGDTLNDIDLSNGVANVTGNFAFTSPDTPVTVGTHSYGVTFTPTDYENYSVALGSVEVTAEKATPTVAFFGAAGNATYGDTLSAVSLSGGSASVPGSFAFKTPALSLTVGVYPYDVLFTPTDAGNYKTVTGQVGVTVFPRVLGIVWDAPSSPMVADGRTTFTVSATATNLVEGDDVTLALSNNTTSSAGSYTAEVVGMTPQDGKYSLPQTGLTYAYNVLAGTLETVENADLPTVKLVSEAGLTPSAQLKISSEEVKNSQIESGKVVLGAYLVELTDGIAPISLSSNVNLKIRIEGVLAGASGLNIYRYDGEKYEKIDSEISGNYLSFNTSEFGSFVFVGDEKAAPAKELPFWLIILLAVVVFLETLALIAVLMRRIARKKSVESDKENDVIADENANDSVNEIVKDSAKEDTKDSANENIKDSVKEIDLAKVNAPAFPAGFTAPSEEALKNKRHFVCKLAYSDEELKRRYSLLKNELLSYTGVKSRLSNGGDSFRRKRDNLARLTIDGKTLRLHLALDVNDERYNDGTCPHKDLSAYETYVEVPFMFKVKSELAVRRAVKLIADVMEKFGLEKDDKYVSFDYAAFYPRPNAPVNYIGEEAEQTAAHDELSATIDGEADKIEAIIDTVSMPDCVITPLAVVEKTGIKTGIEEPCKVEACPADTAKVGVNATAENTSLIAADAVMNVRIRKTFLDKLEEQDEDVKAYYNELRLELLSYDGVKSRISFVGDSFRVKRVNVARLTIDGKTLRLHLPLDPDDERYNDGTCPHKDLSGYESYADIPFMIKIKSGLASRRASKLIADAMQKLNYTKKN